MALGGCASPPATRRRRSTKDPAAHPALYPGTRTRQAYGSNPLTPMPLPACGASDRTLERRSPRRGAPPGSGCSRCLPRRHRRLRIPAGKTKRERIVPLNEEAAEAIRDLQANRLPDRGFRDPITGVVSRYLFVKHGQRLSKAYLFDRSLEIACGQAGLIEPNGRRSITAHRFRHTVGTQLAERGAKLHTIMQVLGHSSASMSMVYARISDREVLRDYQAVLGPGAAIAGPFAETLRSGGLSPEAVDWLKTNGAWIP